MIFLRDYLNKFHEYRVDQRSGVVEIRGVVDKDDIGKTIVLRLLFSHENRRVEIPNIFMPDFMGKKGLGKKIILIVHQALKKYGYQLLIVDLVPGFYDRLVRRGAVIWDEGDSVLITDKTCLD